MSEKKFILNADDFGMSNSFNKAVLEGYNAGFLTSASLVANGKAFNAAVNEVLPECADLSIGVHLNLIEGKSLLTSKKFKNGFVSLMFKAKNNHFLNEVEKEFRLQIEKVQNYTKISHIDSHVHTHAIPELFELVCKLAKEYDIPYIRTQREHFYIVPDFKKNFGLKFPVNILKILLLNYFTEKNMETLKKYNLKTNDYLIGVGYTGMMDDMALEYGLKSIKDDSDITGDILAEALIHPCSFLSKRSNGHQIEFNITQNFDLKDKIERMGFDITNFLKLS